MKKIFYILIVVCLVFLIIEQFLTNRWLQQESHQIYQKQLTDSLDNLKTYFGQRLDTLWSHITLSVYQLPETLCICGQKVPLERLLVREKIEYELFKFLRQRPNLVMWYRLQGRYFPMIESSLAAVNLPDDLKYLVILESLLDPKAKSSVGAGGLWQFMPETGKSYNLQQNSIFDQRYDPWLSTKAARRLVIDLYRLSRTYQEHGDWWLTLAQYVSGSKTIANAVKNQKNSDYFTLALAKDAQRYVPQFIALCVLYKNSQSFGLDVLPQYPPLPEVVDTTIFLSRGGALKDLSEAAGISMDDFLLINTEFLQPILPPGKYKIKKLVNNHQPLGLN